MELGQKAKDKITGFAGTITATADYLSGSKRCQIEALEPTTGKLMQEWFDANRVEAI